VQRSAEAQAKAAQAFAQLLNIAETRDAGQVRTIARFLAATYNGTEFSFDLFDLRTLDIAISDDITSIYLTQELYRKIKAVAGMRRRFAYVD